MIKQLWDYFLVSFNQCQKHNDAEDSSEYDAQTQNMRSALQLIRIFSVKNSDIIMQRMDSFQVTMPPSYIQIPYSFNKGDPLLLLEAEAHRLDRHEGDLLDRGEVQRREHQQDQQPDQVPDPDSPEIARHRGLGVVLRHRADH